MLITYEGSTVVITREKGERCTRSESDLFYRLRNVLRNQGKDVIKKSPGKDGHLTSAPYYIRERKWKWCIFDQYYALRDASKDFNSGRVELRKGWN